MAARPLLIVAGTLVAALTVLVLVGQRVLDRDRNALVTRFAKDRAQGIEEAARGIASEIADIGDDLRLASTLLQTAESTTLAEREMHAIATIKREYLAMQARTDDGVTTNVTAYDAPTGIATLAETMLVQLLEDAEHEPGDLKISPALRGPGERASWYRVFARRPQAHGPSVAVVVDMSVLLSRLRLPREPMSRFVVLDAAGSPAALSDRTLADVTRGHPHVFERLLGAASAGRTTTGILRAELARQIGLPDTAAIAVAVPVAIDRGLPWTIGPPR